MEELTENTEIGNFADRPQAALQEIDQHEIDNETEEMSTSAILENLTIPLTIELSRKRLSLGELGALKDGAIIELNKRPGDLVELIVSGKTIGKGELVNIEGELGVRVVSLAK